MPTGASLHIGLNAVDPKAYSGWSGKLAACEFDANDMQALARKQGFTKVTST
jgi:metacaspase-1